MPARALNVGPFVMLQTQSPTPPLHPKWAIRFSLLVLVGGIACVVLAHGYLLTPWHVAFASYGVVAYISLGFAWSCLEWPSRNAAVRANNLFVLVAVGLVATAAFTTRKGESFPTWAIVVGVIAAIVGYSVAAAYGVRNFIRWRRGFYEVRQQEQRRKKGHYF